MIPIPLNYRLLLGVTHDVLMAALSILLAFYLRLGVDGLIAHKSMLLLAVPVYTLIAAISFKFMGMNKGLWRYASVADLVAILKAATLALAIFLPVMFYLTRLESFPRSVVVIQWVLLVMMLGGPRLIYRAMRDQRVLKSRGYDETRLHIPVLVVGTGDEAELFIRTAQKDPTGRYKVVGIIDDRRRRMGATIHDVPVMGTPEDLLPIVQKLRRQDRAPQRLIFTDEQMILQQKQLADDAEKMGLKLSRLPSLTEFKEGLGNDAALDLKPIAIEDVLGRPQAPLDLEAIKTFIAGRRVIVTGAGGSIGSELVRQIAQFSPSALVLVDNGEYNLYEVDHEILAAYPLLTVTSVLADVRDGALIARVFAQHRPDIVFHAAALKHVPIVELNPSEGILTNVKGTQNVADAAIACGAMAMVQVSTDKAVNPTNIMGATKRLAEYYCQALDLAMGKEGGQNVRTHFMTVRFGNVMGSSGSVVPLFKKQLAKGGPLTVTHPDIKRYFMTTREAVGLILQASSQAVHNNAARGQIFVLDMGEPVKIVDIARRMIRLANLEPDRDIKIIYTGLRPGEKLFEELFDSAETPMPTPTPGTLAAMPRPIELGVLRRVIDQLEGAAKAGITADIYRLLATVIPGYTGVSDTTLPSTIALPNDISKAD